MNVTGSLRDTAERLGQHADDRVWLRVQRHRLADRTRITAERALPEAMSEDPHARVAAGAIFLIEEVAAEHRCHLECRQERGGEAPSG